MKLRKFWLAILVLALVFGMAVVGCDNGTTDGDGGGGGSTGVNELSGKTYYEWSTRIVFSATAEGASSGTYTVGRTVYDDVTQDYILENGKYKYTNEETGTYTWDEGTKTIYLKPEKVADDNGTLLTKSAYSSFLQKLYNQYYSRDNLEQQLEQIRAEYGQEYIDQMLLQAGVTSENALIDYYINTMKEQINAEVEEVFAVTTKIYSFSTDGTALFLEKPLPANKGSNELSGQTYYGISWNSTTQKNEKDENLVYVFTASGYTFTGSYNGGGYNYTETETGTYAYDSTEKYVYLKPSTKNGQTRAEYYANCIVYGEQKFADDNAYRAARTNDAFDFDSYGKPYNKTKQTIGWEY